MFMRLILKIGIVVFCLARMAEAKISVYQLQPQDSLNSILPSKFKIIYWGSQSVIIKGQSKDNGKDRYFKLIDTRPPQLDFSLLPSNTLMPINAEYVNRPIHGMLAAESGFFRNHIANPYIYLPEKIWMNKETTDIITDKKNKEGVKEFSYNSVLEFSEENFKDSDLIDYLQAKMQKTKNLNEKIMEIISFANSTFRQASNIISSLENDMHIQYMDFKLENMVVNNKGTITLIDPDSLLAKADGLDTVSFPKNDPEYDFPRILNDSDPMMRLQWGERFLNGLNTFSSHDNYFRVGESVLKLVMLGVNSLLSDYNSKWRTLMAPKLSPEDKNNLLAISKKISFFLKKKDYFDREEYLEELAQTLEVVQYGFKNLINENSFESNSSFEKLLELLKTSLSIDQKKRATLLSRISVDHGQCEKVFLNPK